MLDCPGSHCSQDSNNSCTHCQTGNGENQLYWDIQLDQDLLETIINIYPEWFKENHIINAMTEESNSPLMPFLQTIEAEAGSPPKVDNQSLKNAMDRNKESLKVKLMLRRPINQLIEQGILPPLRTSPGFHEQRQKLERAKTGDFLKHKIQRRPQRQELIQQHILEDTTVDPSLHEKQRQLKKARLADDLNDRLSHRPGPLELIKGNILHTDEPFEQAVKEGQIHFKKTSEGEVIKHPPPRFVFEEESSSDSASSPQLNSSAEQSLSSLISFEGSNDVTTTQTVVATTGSPTSLSYIVSSPVTSILTSPSTVHSILIGNGNAVAIAAPSPASAVVAVTSNTAPIINGSSFGPTSNQVSVGSPVISSFKDHNSSSKCRKKAKSKAQPKARTIKFHEYKGPPNAKSQQNSNQSSAESSYELLLQQQQLFLQWQLEWQQKYPQIILPAAQKSSADQELGTAAQCSAINQTTPSAQIALRNSFQTKSTNQNATNNESNISIASPPNSSASITQSKFNSSVVGKIISKLEDMKVSDLKAELKKRNLPVSGAKQQLIDRLKPFTESVMANAIANSSIVSVNTSNSILSNDSNESKVNILPNNGDIASVAVKSECAADLVPMSPTVVMGSPPMPNNNEVNRDQQMSNFKQMDQKSPENTMMEVDGMAEETDQCSMDLGNESPHNSSSTSANDDIVLIQQQRIAELQRELQKSQMQLQLQQSSVLPIESQTVTIPLTNGPQFHIVSAQNSDPLLTPIDSSSPKALQRQLLQQHLQQKLQQNMNVRPQQQVNNEANLATLLSNGTISPSVKASLAAFLQSQQQQQQQQQQTLATKLISTQSVPPFQQLVLCPTLCATTESVSEAIHSAESDNAKQRTNSLPNGLNHKLFSQRTSSLPNFNSLIANQIPTEQSNESQIKPNLIITKSPPNYDEATKHINKSKDKKKSVKSQAVDDVLEILIKNGELPASAANDPTTPTTPEKILSLKNQMNPIFPTAGNVQNSIELKQNSNNDNNNNNNKNNKIGVQNNATLDFDFILDLEGLAEAMDMNIAINEKCIKQDKLNNNNFNSNNDNQHQNQSHCNPITLNKTNSNNDLSLSEFMDFQDCALNVEDNNWLEMASTSAPSNEQNLLNFNHEGVETQNHSNNSNINVNNNNNSHPLIASSSLVKSESSKHDPILPNTMFGGNLVDPLGDLFFDDTDFKTSLDLGSLMWDKVDFAT